MTVTYTAQVANSSFGCFLRLLVRWRGSIYKLVWKEFFIFVALFFTLNFVYRFALNEDQRRIFEKVSAYCETYNSLIPVAFVLGFYVSIVVNRWWTQFCQIPWPDRMAMFVTAHVHGQDERGRLMRRTIMRYLCLAYVITFASISPAVKRRFPTWSYMTEAGFMNAEEEKIIDGIQTPFNKYFVPLAWCTSLLSRARKEGRIKDDFAVKTLVDELNAYRGCLGTLFNYDWISIPLVYTQTVTLSVYSFFLSCLMGRQFLENSRTIDMYIPIFTFLQFFFYMGWLKVAETLVNPFGDDDDDFDMNNTIDRNLKVSYLVVDEMHSEHPQLIKDQYWDEQQFDLPYTAGSVPSRDAEFHMGSAMNIRDDAKSTDDEKLSVSAKEAEFVQLASIAEEDMEMDEITTTQPQDIPGTTVKPVIARSHSKSKKGFFGTGSTRRLSSKKHPSPQLNHKKQPSPKINRSSPELTHRQASTLSNNSHASHTTDDKNKEDIFQMSDLESIATRSIQDLGTSPPRDVTSPHNDVTTPTSHGDVKPNDVSTTPNDVSTTPTHKVGSMQSVRTVKSIEEEPEINGDDQGDGEGEGDKEESKHLL